MILTDEKISKLFDNHDQSWRGFAREIEAAVLSKLAGQAEQAGEPVGFEQWAQQILGDNPNWRESGPAELARQAWRAAQQRTAEACAKYLRDRADGSDKEVRNRYGVQAGRAALASSAKAIRNGEWREYQ